MEKNDLDYQDNSQDDFRECEESSDLHFEVVTQSGLYLAILDSITWVTNNNNTC